MLIPAFVLMGLGFVGLFAIVVPAMIRRNLGLRLGLLTLLVGILSIVGFLCYLMRDDDPYKGSLLRAVWDRETVEVQRLLRQGANPDSEYGDTTPRKEAERYLEIAKLMPPKSNAHRTPSVE